MVTLVTVILSTCLPADLPELEARADAVHQALSASHHYMEGWLAYQDPETNLIPQRLDSPLWTPENSAADHYAFMVITAYLSDEDWLAGTVRDILDAEMRLTTRVDSLPDTLDLNTGSYARSEPDLGRILFGASEYCKDGLLPITELMGRTPWTDRMRAMARDIIVRGAVETEWGRLPSGSAEVNGEMLQVLCRLHGSTGDTAFLDAAIAIGDAYFLGVLPANGGIPCHVWDFGAMEPINATLNLSDHGSEIVGGLSEVFAAAWVHRHGKAAEWQRPFTTMLDTLLERSLNQRGILSMAPEGEGGVPDTWGYVYNAYYTAYMLLGVERYRAAVLDALEAAVHYTEWGGADAYADCEEGALVLLNREPRSETFEWLQGLLERHYEYQREDGVIEGWYGDGNSARTWLMWAMYNSGGTRMSPWREGVRWGATWDDESLTLLASADDDWTGTLYFDRPRHRDHMGLTINYPRLNEWPEWWTVDSGALYSVDLSGRSTTMPGYRLIEGIPLELAAGETVTITATRVSVYPHGVPTVALDGPRYVNLASDESSVTVRVSALGDSALDIDLSPSAGSPDQRGMTLEPGEPATVEWQLAGAQPGRARLVATPRDGSPPGYIEVRVLDEPGLLDIVDFARPERYTEEAYLWLEDAPIAAEVDLDGSRQVLVRLRWGSKNDDRRAVLTLAGVELELTHGGYDGFEWLDVPVDLPEAMDSAELTLTPAGEGPTAFLGDVLVLKR